jgi:hypothetical protein
MSPKSVWKTMRSLLSFWPTAGAASAASGASSIAITAAAHIARHTRAQAPWLSNCAAQRSTNETMNCARSVLRGRKALAWDQRHGQSLAES